MQKQAWSATEGSISPSAPQIMPYLFKGISNSAPQFQAWRWAFFVPGAMHVIIALMILAFGQVCSTYLICLSAPQHLIYLISRRCSLLALDTASAGRQRFRHIHAAVHLELQRGFVSIQRFSAGFCRTLGDCG